MDSYSALDPNITDVPGIFPTILIDCWIHGMIVWKIPGIGNQFKTYRRDLLHSGHIARGVSPGASPECTFHSNSARTSVYSILFALHLTLTLIFLESNCCGMKLAYLSSSRRTPCVSGPIEAYLEKNLN